MAYTPTLWQNDIVTQINATRLNKIETGIDDAHYIINIRDWYESNADRNAYTDAEKLKLAGLGDTAVADRVTVNEADIEALEIDVAGLTGDVIILEDKVEALEATVPFPHIWLGSRIPNTVLTDDTYVEINRITTGVLEAGTYGFMHTAVSHYSTLTRSGYCRISPDGGATWMEFNQELKDTTDRHLMTCSNFIVLAVPGVIDIIIQARCEQTGDTFTIDQTVLQLERKL